MNYWTRMAFATWLVSLGGCSSTVSTEPEPLNDESSDNISAVPPSDVGIVLFDGTRATLDQNTSMGTVFKRSLPAAGGYTRYSFPGRTAKYASYTRSDGEGGLRAIYYDGPPEDPLGSAFSDTDDGGSSFILSDALGGGTSSPVCRLVNNPRVKRVFILGWSRGAVLAVDAAKRIAEGICGKGQGAKLAWIGLIDPVATGMSAPYVDEATCRSPNNGDVYNHTWDAPCLAAPTYTNSNGVSRRVPVSLFSKTADSNFTAARVKLQTAAVQGAYVDATYERPGALINSIDWHISMGSDKNVLTKLRAAGGRRGGYSFF
jgi:hypothetical protein